MLNEPKIQPVRDFFRKLVRDFIRRKTVLGISSTIESQEPVISVYFLGILAMRKKYDFLLERWVDLRPEETFH